MAGGTIVDSLFVALGFAPDYSGLDAFKARAEEGATSMLKYGAAAGVAIGALVTKAVVDVSDQFEQNTIAIAGFFDALGVSSSFNAGMKDAADTMDQIIRDAALLPGEADEYIEIFRAGLPVIKDAVPNMDVGQITDFTNKIAAIGHTLKVPAEVASREMQELFIKGEGHATRINILFKRFLPFLRQVEGQANLTTKSFNAMTAEKRVELFKASFQKLNPMLERSASSFDAMKGAIISAAKTLARKGGESLFEGTKRGIAKLNAAFFTADGKLTSLSQRIVEVGNKIGGMVTQAVSSMAALVEWFVTSDRAMTAVKTTAVLLGLAMAGLAFESVAKGAMTLFYALTNLKRLFTGALVVAIGLVAEDLYTFATGGESVTGMLVEKFGPAAEWIAYAVLPALGAALLYVNRQAVGTALALVRPVLPLLAIGAAVYGVTRLWKAFGEKGKAAMVFIGGAAAALFAFMHRNTIRLALELVAVNLPLIATIAILAALGAAIYYVVTRWDTFGAGMKTAVAVAATVLGTLLAAFLAVKAAAITAAVQMAAAWVAANLPIAIGIVLIGLMAVGIYELVKHWDEVTNAIDNAIDALARFFHISDDATGRKGLSAAQAAFDARTKGFGAPTKGREHNDGESTDFLKKKPKAGGGDAGAPAAAPGPGTGLMDKLKGMLPPGIDLGALMGMPGMTPATAGGPALPPGMLERMGGKGGNTTRITNNQTTHVGGINVDARGLKDADDVARKVEQRLQEKNQRVIRNNGSGEEG